MKVWAENPALNCKAFQQRSPNPQDRSPPGENVEVVLVLVRAERSAFEDQRRAHGVMHVTRLFYVTASGLGGLLRALRASPIASVSC
jgi:hypothetical protein